MDAVDQLTGLVGEVDFFLNINELVDAAKAKSIPVCYPEISAERVFRANDLSDITLLKDSAVGSGGVRHGETAALPNDIRRCETASVPNGGRRGADVNARNENAGVSNKVGFSETATASDVRMPGGEVISPDWMRQSMASATILKEMTGDGIATAGVPNDAMSGETASAPNGVSSIVPNDLRLDDSEPLCFIIGANGGGKTSFLRAVGVNLILFLNGAPIFAESASIYPFRSVSTHFPVGEPEISTGRFEEERARADEIIESAGRESFILFNETYSGTNEEKGCASALDAAKGLVGRGAFGLFVTHFARVAYSGFGVLRAVVGDGGERTYKIVKSEQNGSYALDILRKYKIAPEQLAAREVSDEN